MYKLNHKKISSQQEIIKSKTHIIYKWKVAIHKLKAKEWKSENRGKIKIGMLEV